jgi:hypothetical protein
MTRDTEQTVYKCEFENGACIHCEATERGDCQGYVCDDSLYASYTTRPWVDMTDEEMDTAVNSNITITDSRLRDGVYGVALDIAALLKGKNT